jgi:hypothetical protein
MAVEKTPYDRLKRPPGRIIGAFLAGFTYRVHQELTYKAATNQVQPREDSGPETYLERFQMSSCERTIIPPRRYGFATRRIS